MTHWVDQWSWLSLNSLDLGPAHWVDPLRVPCTLSSLDFKNRHPWKHSHTRGEKLAHATRRHSHTWLGMTHTCEKGQLGHRERPKEPSLVIERQDSQPTGQPLVLDLVLDVSKIRRACSIATIFWQEFDLLEIHENDVMACRLTFTNTIFFFLFKISKLHQHKKFQTPFGIPGIPISLFFIRISKFYNQEEDS